MRIGFDVAQTCGEKAGCAWYADELIRAMHQAAPQHQYSLYHHFGKWYNETTKNGTFLEGGHVDYPFRSMNRAAAADCWSDLLEGEDLPGNPQIVHSTSFQAPELKNTKLVFTVFDTSFWMLPEFATEGNRQACQQGVLDALQNAAGFIFISQSGHDEFEKIFPGWLEKTGKPWAVTLLGPKGKKLDSSSVKPAQDPYWLAVGSLEPRKNYEALLDAMSLYWERSKHRTPLHIAGGKGWKSEQLLARIKELTDKGMVKYLGYVPDADLPALYTGAQGFVFPSWYEGFGLPVLEAMSYGCPVISSDRTSLPEVGQDAALYVNPEQPAEIVEHLLHLEEDPAFHREKKAASLHGSTIFSWNETALATLNLYERILNKVSAKP